MSRLRGDAVPIVAAAAVVCALACVLIPGSPYLRLPFALALMFVLPGFALWSAVFPDHPHDPLRTILFSVGLSTVLAVVGGVEMGAYGRLSATSWSVLLAALTLVAAAVAHARRPAARRDVTAPPRTRTTGRVRAGALAGAVTALLVIGVAIGLARTPLPVPHDRGYTVLSIDTAAATPESVALTLTSREAASRAFRLEIDVPGSPMRIEPLRIAPGQLVRVPVAIPPGVNDGVIRARLIDDSSGTPTVYRRVRIGLPVPPPALPAPRSEQE